MFPSWEKGVSFWKVRGLAPPDLSQDKWDHIVGALGRSESSETGGTAARGQGGVWSLPAEGGTASTLLSHQHPQGGCPRPCEGQEAGLSVN